jgi:hypothetical protein
MNRHIFSGIACVMLFLASAKLSQSAALPVVVLGSDYLTTIAAGTTFPGLGNLMGVPLGGLAGNADTIVQREADAVFPSGPVSTAPAIAIALAALQLETVAPVNFAGNGLDNYFVTLQSARAGGGTASMGSMTITLTSADDGTAANPEGTFTSSIDVFFDIRKSSLSGPIVFSTDLVLSNSTTAWDATNPPGAIIVAGPVGTFAADLHTGKASNQMDFFPVGPFNEAHPSGAAHQVTEVSNSTPAPEPGTSLLFGVGLLTFAGLLKRKLG